MDLAVKVHKNTRCLGQVTVLYFRRPIFTKKRALTFEAFASQVCALMHPIGTLTTRSLAECCIESPVHCASALHSHSPSSHLVVCPNDNSGLRSIVPLASVGEVNRPSTSPMLDEEILMLPSRIGNGLPDAWLAHDPAEKPSHCTSVRLKPTDVMAAPSSETVKVSMPLLAPPLISIGPLNVLPGTGIEVPPHATRSAANSTRYICRFISPSLWRMCDRIVKVHKKCPMFRASNCILLLEVNYCKKCPVTPLGWIRQAHHKNTRHLALPRNSRGNEAWRVTPLGLEPRFVG